MSFESGVKSYIRATATVEMLFPVDYKGNADISCRQCWYFDRREQECGLNREKCSYPDKFVGAMCPLVPDKEVPNE